MNYNPIISDVTINNFNNFKSWDHLSINELRYKDLICSNKLEGNSIMQLCSSLQMGIRFNTIK